MVSRFKIRFSMPRNIYEDVIHIFPPIPELYSVKNANVEEKSLFQAHQDTALHIVWIDAPRCAAAAGWQRRNADYDFNKKMLWVGKEVSPKLALILGQLKVRSFYDIDRDRHALLDKILSSYEYWRKSLSREKQSDIDLKKVLIGDCPEMVALRKLIRIAASKDRLMILLRGETGTGKGLVAKLIHSLSQRSEQPFVEINCTAIPDTLVESELFGHEKGAFTDAHRTRKGIFELAHKGTLFLDEIGYLKKETQVKLLKVLEDKKFKRVGGEREIEVDCRIITGTSVDLEQAIQTKAFRSDLYYRLNVFPIWMPPLRNRGLDIQRLSEHFADVFCKEHGVQIKGFSAGAMAAIRQYSWPGNIRELKHAIERAVILCENDIITEKAVLPNAPDMPIPKSDSGYDITIHIPEEGKPMDSIQREIIRHVLKLTQDNRSRAAKLLRISRSRLLRNLTRDEHSDDPF